MKRRTKIGLTAIAITLGAIFLGGYFRWRGTANDRQEILSLMPDNANSVVFVDLRSLRKSDFLAELYAWASQPAVDPDYAEFIQSTGFNFERDLDRAAIALWSSPEESSFLAIADGRFDQKKISAYAMHTGTRVNEKKGEIFSFPGNGSTRGISFLFVRNDRIAISDRKDFPATFLSSAKDPSAADWQLRFQRLAGSPIFVVFRQNERKDSQQGVQAEGVPETNKKGRADEHPNLRENERRGGRGDSRTLSKWAEKAPNGLRSPQLSALLDRMQWITIAGKPEGERLNVVVEGECTAQETTQQLADMLNGVLVLAQAGLNDAKTRAELDPAVRDAYLELVREADVSQIDRGETKAVRLVFGVTPKILKAARERTEKPAATPPSKAKRSEIPAGKP